MLAVNKIIWIEDDKYNCIPAKILEVTNDTLKVITQIEDSEEVRNIPRNLNYTEVHPSCLKGVDDLLLLGDFNKETLLHNTRTRFSQDKIYSFIGMPILIAVNPYKKLDIYNQKNMNFYKKYFDTMKKDPANLQAAVPHLYHLAEAAYNDMLNDKKNQSLIISGESGSGKTESTKIILKYLAISSLDTEEKNLDNLITVEKQVLDSNPLLESFGNAKTVKNNNSSRFGKFIQVSFTDKGKIISARIYNYLLEKSRVVSLQPGERNYHIFYQFLQGADDKEKELYKVKEAEYFNYLNKGCFDIEDADDKEDFIRTKECMNKLNFSQNEMKYLFSILMGILYLGNIEFDSNFEKNIEISIIKKDSLEDFENAAYFLGIDKEKLQEILTEKQLKDNWSKKGEIIKKKLNKQKSYDSRDAIAKALYSKMFDFIVAKVNKAIQNKDEAGKFTKNKIHKIGLLDIFGFENFDKNSFEQLCINYANERLQQYFNNHIFKLEQETYKKEGIDWTQVDFVDNKKIIELIDEGKISIFGLLDSEGITPNSSDIKFNKNVYKNLMANDALVKSDSDNKLSIDHFAGIIEYDVEKFVEKNLDQINDDITNALEQSQNILIKKLFEKKDKNQQKFSKIQSDTLSKQFKTQLDELLKMLGQSNPRYVKCIKPNSEKKPILLESNDVMDQLLCAGVLEAIKIRKQGYNIRRTKEEFYKAYNILTPDINIKSLQSYDAAVKKMLDVFMTMDDMVKVCQGKKKLIQVGKNIVFMKEEIKAVLDYKLNRIKYIYLIQSWLRAVKIRRQVRKILLKRKQSAMKIQAVFRGKLFSDYIKLLRQNTIKLQRNFRLYRLRKNINKVIKHLEEKKEKKLLEEMKKKQEEGKNIQKEQEQLNILRQSQMQRQKMDEDRKYISNIGRESDEEDNKIGKGGKNILKKTHKKINKNKLKNDNNIFFEANDDNIIETQLKNTIEELKSELEETKKERDQYKNENERLKLEKNYYNNYNISSTQNNPNDELIKKLKKDLVEKETKLEILESNLKNINDQKKKSDDYKERVKANYNKLLEKYYSETEALYKRIQDLEITKNEYERRLKTDSQIEKEKDLLNINPSTKTINDLKSSNKSLKEQLDEVKMKSQRTINELRNQMTLKDMQMKSLNSNDELKKLQKENIHYKQRINDLEKNIKELSMNSDLDMQKHSIIRQKENENLLLKNENDDLKLQIDKNNTIKDMLKKQLIEKEANFEQTKKEINEIMDENEKLLDENMNLKKENNLLKTKCNINNAGIKNQNDADVYKLKSQLNEYKKKFDDYENKIFNMENSLDKKNKILESKKKMNLLLIDLAKIKRSEVHCLESINITNNNNQLKDALATLRAKENTIISQLQEATKEDNEMDDSDEEEEEEEEEEEAEEEEN